MTNRSKIIGLGEILWDILPGGKKLGGAPANFAYYATKLGHTGIIASKVGDDALGKEIIRSLGKIGLVNEYIQIDPHFPTGKVSVKLDNRGQPDYIIHENVAWDYFDFNRYWENLAADADVICFGTLAQRSKKSRQTILQFLGSARKEALIILDINLRQEFYSLDLIKRSLKYANILKLNSEELKVIGSLFSYRDNMDEIGLCSRIISDFMLDLLCLTRGDGGSIIFNRKEYYKHQGYKVTVADTVGAGDAFTAAMAVQHVEGKTLKEISELANRLGSWVASKSGPTPELGTELTVKIKKGLIL